MSMVVEWVYHKAWYETKEWSTIKTIIVQKKKCSHNDSKSRLKRTSLNSSRVWNSDKRVKE